MSTSMRFTDMLKANKDAEIIAHYAEYLTASGNVICAELAGFSTVDAHTTPIMDVYKDEHIIHTTSVVDDPKAFLMEHYDFTLVCLDEHGQHFQVVA